MIRAKSHRFTSFSPLLAALFIAILLSLLAPLPGSAQSDPIVYEHLNTEMKLDEQGGLHVRIIQQIRFNGSYSGAFYAIPLENVTSIANVQLYAAAGESDNYELNTVDLVPISPNSIEDNGSEVLIDWNYPQTRPGDVRLFVIEFDVLGVVWVYPDQDFIAWKAVGEDRSGITVNESEVKLTLPDIVPMEQVTATHNASGSVLEGGIEVTGQTITFDAGRPIPDGDAYIVEAYFPHGLLDVGVREWQREADGEALRVDVDRFHADITINADGTLTVQEQTSLTVLEGALHQGVRTIRLLYLDEITEPTAAVNGQPLAPGSGDCTGCFEVNRVGQGRSWVYLDPNSEEVTVDKDNTGLYNIDWYTPLPVQVGESVTTTITYQVHGSLRVREQDQLLTWQVVPDFGQPVRQASLRLTLPPNISPDQVVMDAPDEQGTPQLQPDGSLLYNFDGPVVPGTWQIALTLPANATTAQPPAWQQHFEEVIAEADAAAVARARRTLLERVIGILALVGMVVVGVFWWMRWGRRKVKETLGGYVSEPPSQHFPSMVSFLVERRASERGILGDIFHLASLGLLEIDAEGEVKLRRVRNEPLQGTPRLNAAGNTVPIPRHIQALFDQVLLPGLPHNQWASLDTIATRLRAALPEIYALLAADVQKFFIRTPGSGSDTISGSTWFFVYATLLALMFFEIIPWYIGFVIGFLALLIFVGWSAIHETGQGGYSDEGALEADRWRRFKTYLEEIKKYGDHGAAQEILDRYFGYAVALGVADVVLAQASELGGMQPTWMPSGDILSQPQQQRPRPTTDMNTGTNTGTFPWIRPVRPRPSAPEAPRQRPTLAGMSEKLGSSIRQASRDLGGLLATAAGDASAAPRSVTVNSQLRRREMQWKANTPVSSVLDDILRQSVSDAREIQAREAARRATERNFARREASGWGGGDSGGWGGGGGRSSSRSSSSFGSSSRSSSSSSSRSSSSSSSRSSSSRSSGGGRSGFR
jgi:hypothetical protein